MIYRNSRNSRLPVRLSSVKEAQRSASTDRLSHLNPASAIKRSRSALATPSFTPVRTPSSRLFATPATGRKGTSEQKLFIQNQQNKILAYVEKNEILGPDFAWKGGLKAMTTKHFSTILSHLLKPLVGNRFAIGANYVDDIVKILLKIDYPHMINKSWLKTPSAPHSLNHVVFLFIWLLDLHVDDEEVVSELESLENLELQNDNFLDTTYLKNFKNAVSNAFILWDKFQNKEYEEMIQKLKDEYIDRKISVESEKKVREEIAKIKTKIESMNKTIQSYKNKKKEHVKLINEFEMVEISIEKITDSLNSKVRELQNMKTSNHEAERNIYDLNQQEDELLHKIKNQKMSVTERDNIVKKIFHFNELIASHKEAIAEFETTNNKSQMAIAQLMKTKYKLVHALNNYLYNLNACFNVTYDIPVHELEIKNVNDDNIEEQITDIAEFLISFSSTIRMHNIDLKKSQNELEQKLNARNNEYAVIENDVRLIELKLENKIKEYGELNTIIATLEIELNSSISAMHENSLKLEKTIENDKENLSKNRKSLVMLQDYKQKFMSEVLHKMNSNIDEKEKSLDEAIKQFEELKNNLL